MRNPAAMVALCLLGASVLAARNEPSLPEWSEGDSEMLDSGMLIPGSVLLGTETVNPETGHSDEVAAVPAPDPAEEVEEPPEPPASEIPEEFLASYFDARPETMLVDPQHLLSQQEYLDQLGFLRHHASDSEVDLFVYLFDAEQEIPGEVRVEELVESFFAGDRPAAVAFYFCGAPQRSKIMLGPQLAGLVSESEQRRMLSSSVTKALDKANMVDQLEGFAVQLSIRLYWVEKEFTDVPETDQPLVELPEVPAPEPEGNRFMEWLVVVRPWAIWIGGGLLLGLAGWLGWLQLRRRLRYRFPEIEVAARLGGEHGAGIGAVLTFGNAGVPPSYQRNQVPDYLRRM